MEPYAETSTACIVSIESYAGRVSPYDDGVVRGGGGTKLPPWSCLYAGTNAAVPACSLTGKRLWRSQLSEKKRH